MAAIVPTVLAIGANSVSFQAGGTFANGDTLTYADLTTKITDFAAAEGITGIRTGGLYKFLNPAVAYASNAEAAAAFAAAGGIINTVGISGSTATGSLSVAQTQFLGAAAATGAAPIVRISLSASIAA
jgi:hypothetical protein